MVQWQQCQCGRVSGQNSWWSWANGHRDWIKQYPHFETWKSDVSTRRFCSLRRLTSDRSSRGCFVSEYCRVSDICSGGVGRVLRQQSKTFPNTNQHYRLQTEATTNTRTTLYNTTHHKRSLDIFPSNQVAGYSCVDIGGLQPQELSPQVTLKMSVLGARYI